MYDTRYLKELNPITLQFKDKEKNSAYWFHRGESSLSVIKNLSLLSIFIIALSYFFERPLFSASLVKIIFVLRFGVIIPILLALFAFTFWKKYSRYSRSINLVITLCAGSVFTILSGVVLAEELGYLALISLMLMLILIYGFYLLPYFLSFTVGITLSLAYTHFLVHSDFSPEQSRWIIYLLFAENFILLFVAYWMELYSKRNYIREQQLSEMALMDSLTRLKNRYFFTHFVKAQIETFIEFRKNQKEEKRETHRRERSFGMLMVDIDHFKKVNDVYGHSAGDEVLKEFSAILVESLRKTDFVIRWGGEEFLIVLRKIDPAYLTHVVRKIGKAINNHPFYINPGMEALKITCSIGFIEIPLLNNYDLENMISLADEALYYAKQKGRNRAGRVLSSKPGDFELVHYSGS